MNKLLAFDTLTGEFPVKFTPDIDFEDQAVVQCYVPVVKIIL